MTEVRALLIKLTGKRKIDETPAALSAEMEDFAKHLMELARNSNLFAEAAGLPLSPGFCDGKEAFEKILALSNPIHRVNQIHAMKDPLESYASAIRALETFVTKWGKAFTKMRDFVSKLQSVEHHLPRGNSCLSMLENWKTAYQSAAMTTEQVWRDLQNTKAAADLELDNLLLAWKEEARKPVGTALQQLSRELEANGLPAKEFQEKLATPLRAFLQQVETESQVVRVAAFPERARRLVADMRSAIADLVEAREKKPGDGGGVDPGPGPEPRPPEPGPQPPSPKGKPTKRIRVVEILGSARIRNEAQWNLVRDRLDETVRQELEAGNEVIIE